MSIDTRRTLTAGWAKRGVAMRKIAMPLVVAALVVFAAPAALAGQGAEPPIETYRTRAKGTSVSLGGTFPGPFITTSSYTTIGAHFGVLHSQQENEFFFHLPLEFCNVAPGGEPGLMGTSTNEFAGSAPDGSQFSGTGTATFCAPLAPTQFTLNGTSVTTGGTGRFAGACATGSFTSTVDQTTDPDSFITFGQLTSFTC